MAAACASGKSGRGAARHGSSSPASDARMTTSQVGGASRRFEVEARASGARWRQRRHYGIIELDKAQSRACTLQGASSDSGVGDGGWPRMAERR